MKTISRERKPKIRILIITLHAILCESLCILVESNEDMSVAGCTTDLKGLNTFENFDRPNVALLYLTEGDTDGVEIVSRLAKIDSQIRIIAVTGSADIANQTRALQLGAVGIVHREQNSRNLVSAIRQVSSGETWINQSLLTKLLNGKQSKNDDSKHYGLLNVEAITTREREVIEMIGLGLKNKEIAEKLFISDATVRHHLSSIYGKLGVTDRLNLVIYAYQHSLIRSPQQMMSL